MPFAVVHYPETDLGPINQLRSKYDPRFYLIEPHITLIFPFADSFGESTLVCHVEDVLEDKSPFQIRLRGLQRSGDDYLFLLIEEGEEEVRSLHMALYTGILAPHHRSELPYVPHLTLGAFSGAIDRYPKALKEAMTLELDSRSQFDRAHIIKVNEAKTRIVWSRECLLGG